MYESEAASHVPMPSPEPIHRLIEKKYLEAEQHYPDSYQFGVSDRGDIQHQACLYDEQSQTIIKVAPYDEYDNGWDIIYEPATGQNMVLTLNNSVAFTPQGNARVFLNREVADLVIDGELLELGSQALRQLYLLVRSAKPVMQPVDHLAEVAADIRNTPLVGWKKPLEALDEFATPYMDIALELFARASIAEETTDIVYLSEKRVSEGTTTALIVYSRFKGNYDTIPCVTNIAYEVPDENAPDSPLTISGKLETERPLLWNSVDGEQLDGTCLRFFIDTSGLQVLTPKGLCQLSDDAQAQFRYILQNLKPHPAIEGLTP